MVFFFEFPIIIIVLIVFGFLGMNIVPVLTFLLAISLAISILWLFFAERKLLNLFTIVIQIALIIFLDDKKFYLWDILEWLF